MFDSLVSILIRVSALMVLSGWALSALAALMPRTYLIVGLLAAAVIAYKVRENKQLGFSFRLPLRIVGWLKRRRILPLVYLMVTLLVAVGAILYEPNNFDGLSYRVPKLIFWLKAERWCWIDSPYVPVNYTLPNYEWLTMPLFLSTSGVHAQILINLVSFLLLPSLFFVLFRALGVPRRMAYDWMWLFPCGYGIALQAGGIGNDLLGLTAILASLYCAFRFVISLKAGFLFDAVLAAAFCTGIKLSNPPLVGLVAIVLLGEVRKLLANWRTVLMSLVFGLVISALIPLLLNFHYAGTILGTPPNYAQVANPAAGWVGNGLTLLLSAVEPPIFPNADRLTAIVQEALGARMVTWIGGHYEKFVLKLNELPQEEASSLGLGITFALFVCLALWVRNRGESHDEKATGFLQRWQKVMWWGWLAFSLFVLLAKLGTGPALPRNLLPWYPVVIAPILAIIGKESVARSRLWKVVSICAALSVVPALVLTPSRPLVPPKVLFRLAEGFGTKASALDRMKIVYDAYAQRADAFASLRRPVPDSVNELALVTDGAEPTSSFLKPYGKRICRYLRTAVEVEMARGDGLDFVIINESSCEEFFGMNIERWCDTFRADQIVASDIRIFAAQPPWRYVLVRFNK